MITKNVVKELNIIHYHQIEEASLKLTNLLTQNAMTRSKLWEKESNLVGIGKAKENKNKNKSKNNFGAQVISVWKYFQRQDLGPQCTSHNRRIYTPRKGSRGAEPRSSRWEKIQWTESNFWRCSPQSFLRPSKGMISKPCSARGRKKRLCQL